MPDFHFSLPSALIGGMVVAIVLTCGPSAAEEMGRRLPAAESRRSRRLEGRLLGAPAPHFFKSGRKATKGTRKCPKQEWRAHGFERQCGACAKGIATVRDTACAQDIVTDKVEAHQYQIMYGIFLMPLATSPNPVKMLEIGLGCDMHYEPGASATLWPKLLPNAEIWMAEYDADCVAESEKRKMLPPNLHTLTGDQADPAVTRGWVEKSGGHFDVIIDDGGHSNWQIRSTFNVLWPALKPGGLYFVEDMHPGRATGWPQTTPKDREAVWSDIIQAWIEQLTIEPSSWKPAARRHPKPADVAYIACQKEARVILLT